ncbi:hypothetical protein PINS_up009252 [Pythium insidiosum]|nr:hypothetical protein PINS_up009252 [Pythium insidiosum]
MDPQTKELNVLVRHVPRLVISRFLHKPERPRGPESTSFLAVVALFDISGFSSLGSKLSDDERDKIKATQTTSALSKLDEQLDPLDTASSQGAQAQGPLLTRTSLPVGLAPSPSSGSSQSGAALDAVLSRTMSMRLGNLDASFTEQSDRSDATPRDLMRQRRQSAMASPTAGHTVNGARGVSFISRAKPAAPQGIAVETLTTTLNKTLEPVIDVILQHGGDIIKFAGDALIVVWETEASRGETTAPGRLVYSTVRCALEALRVLHATSQRHGHTSILGMHVGIGVSRVTGNHVGGVLDRWEFYLSGDANRQMSLAEQDAGKGEVALSREAHAALRDVQTQLDISLDVDETLRGNFIVHGISKSPHFAISPSPPIKATLELIPFLRSYVPGAISSYLRKGLALNPTTRNVTTVFIKLDAVSADVGEHEQLVAVHRALCLIQESAYKVQGTLRQFLIDDKGAVAIVAVGLPPFYHENNGASRSLLSVSIAIYILIVRCVCVCVCVCVYVCAALRGVKLACYLLDKGLRASIGYAVLSDSMTSLPSLILGS